MHDHRGAPLTDAVVTVVDPTGSQSGRAAAGEGGRFQVGNLSDGSYTLIASAPGHQPVARATVLNGDTPQRQQDGADDLGAFRLTPHPGPHSARDVDGHPHGAPPAAASYGG